jgi:microcompartment protein CcmL/EutN
MIQCIGFLELNSVAKGVAAADAMMKAAGVELLWARPNCPGKFTALVAGDVSAVDASLAAGVDAGGGAVLESLLIARLHPQVVRAVQAALPVPPRGALGIIEFFSITGAILAADSAVKTADVELLDVRLGTGLGGKSFVVLTGDTSAVSQAVDAAVDVGRERGTLVDSAVIPNPAPGLYESLL